VRPEPAPTGSVYGTQHPAKCAQVIEDSVEDRLIGVENCLCRSHDARQDHITDEESAKLCWGQVYGFGKVCRLVYRRVPRQRHACTSVPNKFLDISESLPYNDPLALEFFP